MKALYYKLFKRKIYKRAKNIKFERAMREYKEGWVKAVSMIYGHDDPEDLIDILDTNTDSYDDEQYEWIINKANELKSKWLWKKTE